jgi:hypothetical protein
VPAGVVAKLPLHHWIDGVKKIGLAFALRNPETADMRRALAGTAINCRTIAAPVAMVRLHVNHIDGFWRMSLRGVVPDDGRIGARHGDNPENQR